MRLSSFVQVTLKSRINDFDLEVIATVALKIAFEHSSQLSLKLEWIAELQEFKLTNPKYSDFWSVYMILSSEHYEDVVLYNKGRVGPKRLRESEFEWLLSFLSELQLEISLQIFENFWSLRTFQVIYPIPKMMFT